MSNQEIWFDQESGKFALHPDYLDPVFTYSEIKAMEVILDVFPEADLDFIEAVMTICGWDEEKRIANPIKKSDLTRLQSLGALPEIK